MDKFPVDGHRLACRAARRPSKWKISCIFVILKQSLFLHSLHQGKEVVARFVSHSNNRATRVYIWTLKEKLHGSIVKVQDVESIEHISGNACKELVTQQEDDKQKGAPRRMICVP
eukprot:1144816-Pelagomonas_calceolata.AAC.4